MKEAIFHKAGIINILELNGTYRQMGDQYGRIFKDKLSGFYDIAINGYFIKDQKIPYLKLLAIARLLFRSYPKSIKEMFSAMAESSGLGLNKIIMLDQLNAFELIRSQEVGRCSNIAVWGDYSKDGKLIFGRNFDEPEYFKKFNEFLTIAVFSPDDGIPTANIGYAGQIGINSAMNKYGIFIANNEAPVIKTDTININLPNILVSEFEFLTRSRTLDELDKFIKNGRTNCPIIVSVADDSSAYTYEWIVSEIKHRTEACSGLMVTTNHFTDPSWIRPVVDPEAYGMTGRRSENLISLGEKYKGSFGFDKMLELLDVNVDNGGAKHEDKTIFQIVVLPKELKFYVKIPDFQDWTEIDLKASFDRFEISR